jgi:rhodanese-related sulfurtransferase
VIVDVRSALGRDQERRCIPGALEMSLDEVGQQFAGFPQDRDIVFYCACPNEASAAFAARKLLDRGHVNVWPLRGGLDAWTAAGYEVEIRLAVGSAAAAAVGAPSALPRISSPLQ